MRVDLHIHTTASDGSDTPRQIFEAAKKAGLDAIAVTDHDNVGALAECEALAAEYGVKFLSGIELSSFSVTEAHILGYNIDYRNAAFRARLDCLMAKRAERARRIIDRLAGFGVEIDADALPKGCVGRVHIARALLAKGYVKSINEAFDRYLGVNRAAYVPSERLTPAEAVRMITENGGIAVLAHPALFYEKKILRDLAEGLKRYGLKGLECFYPSHSEAMSAALYSLSKEYGLIATGGSDYHGANSNAVLGSVADRELDAKALRVLGLS